MGRYAELQREFEALQEKYIKVFGEKEELSYELSGLKSKAEEVRSQEAQIRALHESVRRLKHDMKNHLMVLASYLNSSDLEAAKENRFGSYVLERNPKLTSDKPETGSHGLGVPQIKEIVEKYNGMYDFYEEDGWFCAGAFIPR